jgi:hypothetical protein
VYNVDNRMDFVVAAMRSQDPAEALREGRLSEYQS